MIRLGMTLGVREDKIDEYKRLHANVWPEILDNLTELNLKTFLSIYIKTLFLVIWNITGTILKEITN